jgi:hypothetical protein
MSNIELNVEVMVSLMIGVAFQACSNTQQTIDFLSECSPDEPDKLSAGSAQSAGGYYGIIHRPDGFGSPSHHPVKAR